MNINDKWKALEFSYKQLLILIDCLRNIITSYHRLVIQFQIHPVRMKFSIFTRMHFSATFWLVFLCVQFLARAFSVYEKLTKLVSPSIIHTMRALCCEVNSFSTISTVSLFAAATSLFSPVEHIQQCCKKILFENISPLHGEPKRELAVLLIYIKNEQCRKENSIK